MSINSRHNGKQDRRQEFRSCSNAEPSTLPFILLANGLSLSHNARIMCGIAGIFYKGKTLKLRAPVGEQLVKMMEAMRHRGADSTGFTVAGEPAGKGDLILRLCAPNAHNGDGLHGALAALRKLGAQIRSKQQIG